MKKHLLLIFVLLSFGCSGSGLYKDVQGTLKASNTTLTISSSPTPTITLLGRSASEFEVEYVTTTLDSSVANFLIKEVPTKQPVIFEIKHPSFDPVISFPFDLTTTSTVTLPALAAGTTAIIIDGSATTAGINDLGAGSVDTTAGMILGQLSSVGSVDGGCSPLTSVQIKEKETGITAAVLGPFYFDSFGNVVNSGHFTDTQCSYVMANILAGNYDLEYLDASLQIISTYEVVVLPGNVTFGMDVP